eukprot:1153776-Pelagomonas_calceolata.AAC.3
MLDGLMLLTTSWGQLSILAQKCRVVVLLALGTPLASKSWAAAGGGGEGLQGRKGLSHDV